MAGTAAAGATTGTVLMSGLSSIEDIDGERSASGVTPDINQRRRDFRSRGPSHDLFVAMGGHCQILLETAKTYFLW